MGPPPAGAMGAVPPSPGFQGAEGPGRKLKLGVLRHRKTTFS